MTNKPIEVSKKKKAPSPEKSPRFHTKQSKLNMTNTLKALESALESWEQQPNQKKSIPPKNDDNHELRQRTQKLLDELSKKIDALS